MERVDMVSNTSFKYLGVTITQDPSWSLHVKRTVKKARQCLFLLRRLRDFRLRKVVCFLQAVGSAA